MKRLRDRELVRLVRADAERYVLMLDEDDVGGGVAASGAPGLLRALALSQGLQATVVYRVGHAVTVWEPGSDLGKAVRLALRIVHFAVGRSVEIAYGIRINEHARIGPGLHIAHCVGIVVGPATLGSNCNLSQNVTIGRTSRRGDRQVPTIGDRVWVGPGAVLVGGIHVGDDVTVGANGVVTRDLPDRAVALGIPARVHRRTGSFAQVTYPGMLTDPARQRSLRAAEDNVIHLESPVERDLNGPDTTRETA